MWLQENLFRRQPCGDEFVTEEVGENNIGVNLFLPGLQEPMDGKHRRNDGGVNMRFLIAAMNYSRPRHGPTRAIFANPALPMAGGRGTHQARVMQGLHNRDFLLLANAIRGGGNQGKRIMKVRDVGPFATQERSQVPRAVEGPDCLEADLDPVDDCALRDLVVVSRIFENLFSCKAQQFSFATKDFVFSARVTVPIVGEEQFHTASGGRQNFCRRPSLRW